MATVPRAAESTGWAHFGMAIVDLKIQVETSQKFQEYSYRIYSSSKVITTQTADRSAQFLSPNQKNTIPTGLQWYLRFVSVGLGARVPASRVQAYRTGTVRYGSLQEANSQAQTLSSMDTCDEDEPR